MFSNIYDIIRKRFKNRTLIFSRFFVSLIEQTGYER